MQPVSNDATTALLRAIRARVDAGLVLSFDEIRSRSWASATFVGARHELSFTLRGSDAANAAQIFVESLETTEFSLRGHILADIALVSYRLEPGADAAWIWIEALTVEEC